MIPVARANPPDGFDFENSVAIPGQNALWELIGDPRAARRTGRKRNVVATRIQDIPANKLPSFWTKALPHLCVVYAQICAYLGLRIHPGTGSPEVDHFMPKDRYQHLAYSWDNFRLSCKLVNTFKSTHEDVVDPFEVGHDWFGINLATGHVVPRTADVDLRTVIDQTITRLHLNSETTFVLARLQYIDDYLGVGGGPTIPFEKLERDAPFVAREIERQGKKRT